EVVGVDGWRDYLCGGRVFVAKDEEEYTRSVALADAAILISGAGGTRLTGLRALGVDKPVLPLADTGNDATEIFRHLMSGEFLQSHPHLRGRLDLLRWPAPAVVDHALALLNDFASRRLVWSAAPGAAPSPESKPSADDLVYVNGINGVTGDYLVKPFRLADLAAMVRSEPWPALEQTERLNQTADTLRRPFL